MRIAVLYICTGQYTIFWPEFYASCEEYFFLGHRKEYFVFTDGIIEPAQAENVHRIDQKRMGWPYDTLMRFNLFECRARELEGYDLIFFCNANVEFVRPVGEEILPLDHRSIITVQHPGYVDGDPQRFPFEQDPRSRAYIEPGQGKVYVCGGFNGGYATAYLQMIRSLNKNIQFDLQEGIIARWHDESHINRYIIEHSHHVLPVSYCYPQYEALADVEMVRIRDKTYYGGSGVLRFQPLSFKERLRERTRYALARLGVLPCFLRLYNLLRNIK